NHLMNELLVDPLVEGGVCNPIPLPHDFPPGALHWTVLLKPGVMDPTAESVLNAARDMGVPLESVRTFRRYILSREGPPPDEGTALRRVLANDAIEQIVVGDLQVEHLTLGQPYAFRLITMPLRGLDDAGLQKLSREGQLSLNLAEMRAIQEH